MDEKDKVKKGSYVRLDSEITGKVLDVIETSEGDVADVETEPLGARVFIHVWKLEVLTINQFFRSIRG